MVIMNDLEWPMLSYYVIYYEKFRKIMKRTEKVPLIKFQFMRKKSIVCWHMPLLPRTPTDPCLLPSC